MSMIGKPIPRVDGVAKVTGGATYAAEFRPTGMLHGAVVQSAIAFGRILDVDDSAARRIPGVVRVLTWRDMPSLPWKPQSALVDPTSGAREKPLQSDRVIHPQQHVALVVATSHEAARQGAALVRMTYAEEPTPIAIGEVVRKAQLLHGKQTEDAPPKTQRGDPEDAFEHTPAKVDAIYVMPRENNNPMEPHATIAAWQDGELRLWDKTQWTQNDAACVAAAFGIEPENVRVICPFVGGAFGSSLRVWPQTFLAAMAAKVMGRPVKIELSRREYYGGVGCRPWTQQRIRVAATREGKIMALMHDAVAETSLHEDYIESVLSGSQMMYAVPNVGTSYRLAKRPSVTPTPMRAPGETTGQFALECAVDELAVALEVDPLLLRLRNIEERDLAKNLPFSSNAHAECLRRAAAVFGWQRRSAAPRSMRDGRMLIGQGIASATYPTHIAPAEALARLNPDGTVDVLTAASDMGPGTWTSATQVAADTLGLPVEQVKLRIGDSTLPKAPVHGGSITMASVGHAVRDACLKLREALHRRTGSNDLAHAARQLDAALETRGSHDPGDLSKKFSTHAFGAVCAEVAVDPDTSEVRVRRVVGAYGNGRIINPRLARSQCIGGFVMGIGQALMERTEVDDRSGRVVNANLAEYLVPVLADTPEMGVIFIEENDPHLGPLGAKGIGELALCGIGPAIANAVFHATGRRVRELPITPDKLVRLSGD